MNETVRSNGGHGFLVFALGTAVGAVVALLTAPHSGKETRRRLQGTLKQVKERAGNVRASVTETYARGAEVLRDGVVKAFDKDPARVTDAREGSRQATGAPSKSELMANYNTATSPARTGPSYGGNSPK
jgi:gas vesicle protein